MSKPEKPEPILLCRRATMRLLRVSDATFDRMIEDILPPGIPFGNRRRWCREALIEHLNRRTETRCAA